MRISKGPNNTNFSDNTSSIINTRFSNVLDRLSAGVNTRNGLTIRDEEPSTSSSTCFYAVVSIEGITSTHEFLQIISRACTICVLTFATSLFTSATSMSVSVSLIVLSLVLFAGVFTGRSHVDCVQDEQVVSTDSARRGEEQGGRGQIQILIQ